MMTSNVLAVLVPFLRTVFCDLVIFFSKLQHDAYYWPEMTKQGAS